MLFLPDTNMIIAVTRHNDRRVARQIAAHQGEVGLSSIVLHELYFGAFASERSTHHLATIVDLRLPRLEFDDRDARVAGEVRATLRRAGKPIGPYDILIAGQALARDLTLVTANTREFARVEGLRIENWTSGA